MNIMEKYKIEMIGEHMLFNGDCLEVMDMLIESGIKVDAIITDIPYQKTKNIWDSIIPFDAMWNRLNKLIKPNGVIVLFGMGSFTAKLILSNEKDHRYNLIWNKKLPSGFLNANRMPLPVHEDIIVFYKKSPTYNPQKFVGKPNNSKGNLNKKNKNNNYGDFKMVDNSSKDDNLKFPRSILEFQKSHPSKSVHPTMKPVKLMEYLIKTYTNEGKIVLDFTMGSETTGVACKNTNRKFIGIELDEKYFNIAKDRIEENILGGKNE